MSTQEAALLRLREMALKGDARALDRLLALAQIFNNGAAIESLGTVAAKIRRSSMPTPRRFCPER